MVEKFRVEKSGAGKFMVEKSRVEKLGVEMSFNQTKSPSIYLKAKLKNSEVEFSGNFVWGQEHFGFDGNYTTGFTQICM